MAHVAFLGTGLIGAGMIEGLRKRGERVRVWNRTADKARALEPLGVEVSATAAEAVRGAGRVHIAVSDDAAVDSVLASIDGALDVQTPLIDHTTTSPAGTAARYASLTARGVAFLHAPVFMSPQACRESTGIMLASGPRGRFEALEHSLRPMTGNLWWLGERPDLAASFKLFGNAMILTITGGVADILTLARSLDVSGTDALTLFTQFKPASTIDIRGKRMALGDFSPSFELTMARKDLRLMLETAASTDAPLTVLPALAARFDELVERGYGSSDVGVVAVDAVRK
ncbi:NAD(P)-dependent oxidoreductase [Pendulispora albinea]|uniref:NAD(P)-dependent oxidoreductase n=1 Tax=Pendulispora albinea TaxID=2741071 RepID=A0ABZ2M5V6_9BACT